METNPPPKTAEQINRPLTGQHSYQPDSVGVVLNANPVYLKSRVDELEFALMRIVNLLEHADPMYALTVARDILKGRQ